MSDDESIQDQQETPLPEIWVLRLYELDEAAKSFKASSLLNPNTTQYPNFITDWLMALLTAEELVVLTYAVRHTLGYQKHDDDIGVDQFQYGIIRKDGRRLDCGTGLGDGTIRKALQFLCDKLGILIARKRGSRSTNYRLNDGQDATHPLNLKALVTREAALQSKMGERWIGKAAHAREERATLKNEQQPAMNLTAKDTEPVSYGVRNDFLTAKETSFLQLKNTKPTYQNQPPKTNDVLELPPPLLCPNCRAAITGKPRRNRCPGCGAALLADLVGGGGSYTIDPLEAMFLAYRKGRGCSGKPTQTERADAVTHCRELLEAGYTAAQVEAFTCVTAAQAWTTERPNWGLGYVCKSISKAALNGKVNSKPMVDINQQTADAQARELAQIEAATRGKRK